MQRLRPHKTQGDATVTAIYNGGEVAGGKRRKVNRSRNRKCDFGGKDEGQGEVEDRGDSVTEENDGGEIDFIDGEEKGVGET